MPARLKAIPCLPLIVALTVLRLIAGACAGLTPDEAYYWLWAQHPALGYYDHPPMVAWWIMAMPFTRLTPLMVRLPFILSFLPLCWLVFDTARALFDAAVARRALLWLNACVLLSVGCVIATPDPPSVLMWAGGMWALARLLVSQKGAWWLAFGLFAGLGVEAKYTNLFLGLGVIAWFVIDKPSRRWLATPWPWLGGLAALAVAAPNLAWNAQHDWVTVGKQFGRIGASQFTLRYLGEFVLSQPLLLNALVFVFAVIGGLAAFQGRDSRLRLLAALPLPLLAYLLVHVFHDRIQGNWPAPVYPGLVILAAVAGNGIDNTKFWAKFWARFWRARDWAAPFGIGLSVLALLVLAFAPALPGAASLGRGWDGFARTLSARARQADAAWIATTDYDSDAELRYHVRDVVHGAIDPVAERERYAWLKPDAAYAGTRALIVVAPNHHPDLVSCFDDLGEAGTAIRGRPGRKTVFRLYTGRLRYAGCVMR